MITETRSTTTEDTTSMRTAVAILERNAAFAKAELEAEESEYNELKDACDAFSRFRDTFKSVTIRRGPLLFEFTPNQPEAEDFVRDTLDNSRKILAAKRARYKMAAEELLEARSKLHEVAQ